MKKTTANGMMKRTTQRRTKRMEKRPMSPTKRIKRWTKSKTKRTTKRLAAASCWQPLPF